MDTAGGGYSQGTVRSGTIGQGNDGGFGQLCGGKWLALPVGVTGNTISNMEVVTVVMGVSLVIGQLQHLLEQLVIMSVAWRWHQLWWNILWGSNGQGGDKSVTIMLLVVLSNTTNCRLFNTGGGGGGRSINTSSGSGGVSGSRILSGDMH